MEPFLGTWNLVESDNFEAFLEQVGVPKDKIIAAGGSQPRKIVIEKTAVGFKFSSLNGVQDVVIEFQLDKEFEIGPFKNTVSIGDGKMIQTQSGVKPTRIERWVEGNKMIASGECEGVKYKQVYERA
ncbi:hypothetical protein FO519_001356 [Halicephalobus sp. NKZ332]|nr:hypothetical protein FO519_001356 [Halicephalobus sp. NKZ332]